MRHPATLGDRLRDLGYGHRPAPQGHYGHRTIYRLLDGEEVGHFTIQSAWPHFTGMTLEEAAAAQEAEEAAAHG